MENNIQEEHYASDEEINLLDCLLVLLKRKRFIVTVTLVITVLTAAISFFIPKTFKAEAKILPPVQNQSASAQMLSQLSGMAGFNILSAGGIKTPGDLYVSLVKSTPVLEAIIDRFKIMELHKLKYRQDARQLLGEKLKAQEEKKTGIITIEVEDRDPKRAADMANAFVEELKNFNRGLAVTEASQRRLFYEEQLKDVRGSLVNAEESMKGFQEKTGAVKIDEQAKAVIQSIAQVRAQIAAKEVQLKVMKTYATAHNPDAQRLEEEVRGLKEQLARLEAKGGQNPDPLMGTSRIPQVGTDYLRKMREVKFNETLYEILLKQFEAAKLDEARDAAVIQVIEKATQPEKKFKPKRGQMTLIAFIVSLFLSVVGAFLLESLEKSQKSLENRERMEQVLRLSGLDRLNYFRKAWSIWIRTRKRTYGSRTGTSR